MNTTEIVVSRVIPAPAERVFELWLDAKSPGGPWYGAGRLILKPVVDGLFFFSVNHAGKTWPHYGRFTQIERPRVVEYTWMSEATKGLESLVTVTFDARDKETEVTLRHSGVPDDEMGLQHQDGWSWMLNALAESLGDTKAGA